VLEYKEEEGESIEPKYFLPIIPTILLNGSSELQLVLHQMLNRNIKDIIDASIKTINGKNIQSIKPHLNGFTGEFVQDTENSKVDNKRCL
jgi:DNA topoisomerase-2